MGNITLALPEDVHQAMRHFSEVRWSEVARKAIIERLETLSLAEKLAKKSKLSKKDVSAFGKKIKHLANRGFLNENRNR